MKQSNLSKQELDKQLQRLTEEERNELAKANRARYMRDYYAKQELKRRGCKADAVR